MFKLPEGMTPVRKWNFIMLFVMIVLLFANEIAGKAVEVGPWIDWCITACGIGLGVGVFLQYKNGK